VACDRIVALVDQVFAQALTSEAAKADDELRRELEDALAGGPVGSGPDGADVKAAVASAGLSISGCAEVRNQIAMRKGIVARRPSLLPREDAIIVGNDTVGSAFTASASGGLVIICGTGTMAEAFLPDGRSFRAGGWGHMLGDEAGGYWIVQRALAAAIRADDGFDEDAGIRPADPRPVLRLATSALGRATKQELLADFYGEGFSKARVAALCKPLAELARSGDPIAREAFASAGRCLGGMFRTLAPRMVASGSSDVTIVAVGSVWLAWDLLSAEFETAARWPALALVTPGADGFVDGPRSEALRDGEPDPAPAAATAPITSGSGFAGAIRLRRLRVPSAVGAAALAARQVAGVSLPLDYDGVSVDLDDVIGAKA